jgi:hypothetical protein
VSGAVERLLARAEGRLATARPLLPGRFEPAGPAPDWLPERSVADESRQEAGEGTVAAGEPRRQRSPAPAVATPATVEKVGKEVRVAVEQPSLEVLGPAVAAPRRPGPDLSAPLRPALELQTPAPAAAAPEAPGEPPTALESPVREARAAPAPASGRAQEPPPEPPPDRGPARPLLPELEPSRPPSLAEAPRSSAPSAPVPPRPLRAGGAPVEVRIGHIEVRAAAPVGVRAVPPGARDPRPGRRPAVSLDDYLSRRRGA